ncbi:MAG TPA: penicillin acylase family protein [Flavobacteriales bacterium]
MKWIKRILVSLIVVVLLLIVAGYFWLKSSAPDYSGQLELAHLAEPVDVYFDEYGIPHLYAQNKQDLYTAFGYIHAQDRLFQMEMMRRVGSGTLSEIIGRKALKTDMLFKTLGLVEYAQASAEFVESQKGSPMYNDLMAYLKGVNLFIEHGKTPPEFALIGIEKRPFTLEDMFYITGAMSFSFSQAQRSEPIVDFIYRNLGEDYLRDIALWHDSTESYIRTNEYTIAQKEEDASMRLKYAQVSTELAKITQEIESMLPMAPLDGSNAWVLNGQKTKSGEVLFCNDTHIGYTLPQTWYEAHLSCPNFEMYGHFMAGIPFALVGRNRDLSWGLTMLLNDDMDFYYEKRSADNPLLFLYDGEYMQAEVKQHTIKIKGEADTTIQVIHTIHGPIINEVFEGMNSDVPISMYWTYTKKVNRTMNAFYGLNNANDLKTFASHLPDIHAPGLNVNYGDKLGNIAWWGCASLIKRPTEINSFTILDGTTSSTYPLGFYDFSVNPKCINPEWNYIYSANDWPQALKVGGDDSLQLLWYPGYYKPQYRADRIREVLETRNDWDSESIQQLMNDYTNKADASLMSLWHDDLIKSGVLNEERYVPYHDLFNWNGEYAPHLAQPTLFNKILYHYLRLTVEDEIGEELFHLLLQTHLVQRTHTHLYRQNQSKWWDNVNTPSKETREEIIVQAFKVSVNELENQFGKNIQNWQWKNACTLELRHPLSVVPVLGKLFTIAAKPVYGGNETVMQSGFKLNGTGTYNIIHGSQMRIIVDFAHVDSTLNITPSGNSGHLMSKHYDDQATMYRDRQFRPQWMNKERVEHFNLIKLLPE